MGKITMRSAKELVRKKVEETMEGTIIHQRQRNLVPGRWDFVVFGPSANKKESVLRVGIAEQMVIHSASVYVASIGNPEAIGQSGMMSLEELAGGDIADDLKGLEVYHVSPLRPISVTSRRKGPALERMRDLALKEFADTNTAIIETPDQAAWSLSTLLYLSECDDNLPDQVMCEIRNRMRDTSISFSRDKDRIN